MLKAPRISNGELQWALEAPTNELIIIERSVDARTWVPIRTNAPGPSPRLVSFPATAPQAYFRAKIPSRLSYALLVRTYISRNGNALLVDSFDSTDTNTSTAGQYDPLRATDRGHVAAGYGLTNAGTVQIYGQLCTGPVPNMGIEIGPQGTIGSMMWHMSAHKGIQPGYWLTNLVTGTPSVVAPMEPGFVPAAGTIDGQFYDYVLNNGNYELNSLNLSSVGKMLVRGSSRLYVRGNISLTGQSLIQLEPGATLTIYAGGQVTFAGAGIAGANAARSFMLYGLPGCTRVQIGVSPYVGAIYAPEAEVVLSGETLIGAVVGNEIRLTRAVEVHFDEQLKGL